MKILKIIHGYPPEYNAGSEVYSQSLCNELIKKHDVVIFSREENEYDPDFRIRETVTEHGIPHYLVNMARGKDGYNHKILNENFRQLIKEIKPNVAHIGHLNHLSIGIVDVLSEQNIPILFTLHDFWLMCPRGQFLQRNFDAKALYRLCEKQDDEQCAKNCYSMYFSGIENKYDNELYRIHSQEPPYSTYNDTIHWTNWVNERMKQTKKLCSKVGLFHAPSKYLMNRFINDFGIPENKIFYLDYGFPMHYLEPIKKHEGSAFTFGYIGTHIPAKGINLLIEAFKNVKGNVKLKIFGRTNGQSTAALKNLIDGSKNPVSFEGEYVNSNLATKVFNQIDCIVVPSIWGENSPLVIHEAQACKVPVITANYGGMSEYVEHKVNGLLFTHRNSKSLTEQMQFAADNPEELIFFGQRGYLYSKEGKVPTIEEHCNLIEEKYKILIKNGN